MTTPIAEPPPVVTTPAVSEIIRALIVAVFTFLCTFIAALICEGANIFELSVVNSAIEAAVAAGLGILGYEIFRMGRAVAIRPKRVVVTRNDTVH